MKSIYGYAAINADTQVFAVIGDPVAHSLSPLIHNTAFRSLRMNAVYLPARVPRTDLTASLKAFERLGIRGYSVTIPHKEAAATLAITKDEAVTLTHAANTLVRDHAGFAGHNTDYQGFVASLRANLPKDPSPTHPDRPVADRVALVLGAGGIARAVATALGKEGALVTITNRTEERGKKLAEDVGCKFVEWGARHNTLCDLLVNCTSVGMHPNVDDTPVHHSFLKPGLIVFDTVYTPETTLLVKEARQRECHVITGVDLFVRQAALQFKLFTGHAPPAEIFRKVIKRDLAGDDQRRGARGTGGAGGVERPQVLISG